MIREHMNDAVENRGQIKDHWLVKRTLYMERSIEGVVPFVPIVEGALVFFFGGPSEVIEPFQAITPLVTVTPVLKIPLRFKTSDCWSFLAFQCRASVLSRVLDIDFSHAPEFAIPLEEGPFYDLFEELKMMGCMAARTERVFSALEQWFPEAYQPDAVDRVYDQIVEGVMPLSEIIQHCGMSQRTLQRKFLSRTGVTPKRFHRIARVSRGWRTIEEHPDVNVQDIVFQEQYCDQAHFIKDFKLFAGAAPKRFSIECPEETRFFAGLGNLSSQDTNRI